MRGGLEDELEEEEEGEGEDRGGRGRGYGGDTYCHSPPPPPAADAHKLCHITALCSFPPTGGGIMRYGRRRRRYHSVAS